MTANQTKRNKITFNNNSQRNRRGYIKLDGNILKPHLVVTYEPVFYYTLKSL